MDTNIIHNMDCLGGMKELPDNSVDLVIADPPYYKIKSEDWDNQWKTFEDYLDWVEKVSLEIKRVMKDNGSFYIFGDDHRIAYIQVRLDKHFTFLNHLVWFKINNLPVKSIMNNRKYSCMSERILFYSKQDQTGLERVMLDIDNFQSLREYAHKMLQAFCCSLKMVNEILGHRKAEHFFYWNSTQWDLPTEETYNELLGLTTKGDFKPREYEDLRREYEDLRRPFNPSPKLHEIITEPIITQAENTDHPTTKPHRLIRKLIKASSNEGDIILDPFMGSGTTALACLKLNRKFIGYEISEEYCKIAEKRIEGWRNQTRLPSFVPPAPGQQE